MRGSLGPLPHFSDCCLENRGGLPSLPVPLLLPGVGDKDGAHGRTERVNRLFKMLGMMPGPMHFPLIPTFNPRGHRMELRLIKKKTKTKKTKYTSPPHHPIINLNA